MADFDASLSPTAIESTIRSAHEKLERAGELQELIASVVGTAESQDGRIRVECTNGDPLHTLQIDPRAMRMGSEGLAETIQTVVREAVQDLRNRSQLAVQEKFGGQGFDPAESRKRIQEARESFERIAVDAQGEMDRLSRRLANLMPDPDEA